MAEAQEDGTHIGIEYIVIDGAALLFEGRASFLEAGIVECSVKTAVTFDRCADETLDILLPGHVGPDRERLRPQGSALGRGGFDLRLTPARDDDRRRASSAILIAAARPMPLPPPVTRQTFPFIRFVAAFRGPSAANGSLIPSNSRNLHRQIVV